MNRIRTALCALAFAPAIALSAPAAPVSSDAQWYLHANLLEMRETSAGQYMYAWLEDEVLEEISEELGFEFGSELDGVTVFGSSEPEREDAAVILHGYFSTKTRDAMLEAATDKIGLESEAGYGRTYYRLGGSDAKKVDFDGGFLAFGDNGQTMITGKKAALDAFLAADAHYVGAKSTNLITIQAESALIHGSVDAEGVRQNGGPFDSHMFQNVERLGLVIDDNNGLLDIQVFVTATDPTMAQAIQNIIQGLISLKVLDDGDPEAAALLENLTVSTEGTDVRMQLLLEPELMMDLLD